MSGTDSQPTRNGRISVLPNPEADNHREVYFEFTDTTGKQQRARIGHTGLARIDEGVPPRVPWLPDGWDWDVFPIDMAPGACNTWLDYAIDVANPASSSLQPLDCLMQLVRNARRLTGWGGDLLSLKTREDCHKALCDMRDPK